MSRFIGNTKIQVGEPVVVYECGAPFSLGYIIKGTKNKLTVSIRSWNDDTREFERNKEGYYHNNFDKLSIFFIPEIFPTIQ